jgi:NRAMP (natural resistance-associated macrophage protein)-like metal ion transporter
MNETSEFRPWYRRIGPSLITACVVIGPGSIMTSSSVGARNGYSMLWVVVIAVAFMLAYMTLGAKLGAVADRSPGDLLRQRAGHWLAVLVGASVFFIAAAFQSGNNIGVAAAFEAYIDSPALVTVLVIAFNAIAITFLFAFKNLYRMIERLMMTFVAIMLVSFAVNLVRLEPDPAAMLRGFVPSFGDLEVAVLGLIATTFVVAAAYYQSYLVREKGWDVHQVRDGILDARVGSIVMALITVMLMSTAAAGLYRGTPVALDDPIAVAESLEATFGSSGKIIFCIGLFSAAYSSFLVNSMIGGYILSDGLGLGSKANDRWPRLLTALVLLTGMVVALATMLMGFDRTPTIIAAQAVTVVAAPLVAGVLFWLTSSPQVMGRHVSGPATKTFAAIGFAVLLAIAANTALFKLPDKIRNYQATTAQKERGLEREQENREREQVSPGGALKELRVSTDAGHLHLEQRSPGMSSIGSPAMRKAESF